MHFTSKIDIEAPSEFVFVCLSDFEGWERAAMRRGADVRRTDTRRTPGAGMSWDVQFNFRGKARQLDLKLVALDPGGKLAFTGMGKLIEGNLALELLGLAPRRTRVVLSVEVRPLTLGARLLLQSLKMARGKVQTRLDQRMAQLAKDIEVRHVAARARQGSSGAV